MKKKIKVCALIILLVAVRTPAYAAVIHDRVVAFADSEAITLSQFKEQFDKIRAISSGITGEEVLETMINRLLLLREARKYRIDVADSDEMLREFMNLKIRAFIRVSDAETEEFYKQNVREFGGRDLEAARAEIETYLTEKGVNEKLREMLRDLRKNAYIQIQLSPGE